MYFTWVDYIFFCIVLSMSAAIGIYFGCFGSKQSTSNEYFFGGKSMHILPIAMSLLSSNLSGVTLLGVPSEIYFHGTQFSVCLLSAVLLAVAVIYIFLPIFYKLQLMSTYEYFKLRFDGKVQKLASLLYVVTSLLYIPMVIYLPSLAFNQVTGIEMWKVCPVICIVCIFYTTIGGLKAVVFSDTLQFCLTLITMSTVMVIGIYSVGGVSAIWETAEKGQRIEFFNMNLDPTERTTFWTITIGATLNWISGMGLSASSVQRFLCLPSLKSAQRAVVFWALGIIITKSISCFSGIMIYAKYFDCDPLTSGKIQRQDQLLPYFLLDTAGHLPGLPGLFIAGIFCTALSTMSTSLNTLSGTIYEDFIKSHIPKATDETINKIMKSIVILGGLISLALVILVDKLGGILELSWSLNGIPAGPTLGLFSLGMFFPSANATGALWGGIASTIFISILVFGTQFYNVNGSIKHLYKPISTDGCLDFNSTIFATTLATPEVENQPIGLFLVSFYYYTLLGALIAIIIGLLISWITNKDEANVNPDLICPCIYWLYPKATRDKNVNYTKNDKALKIPLTEKK